MKGTITTMTKLDGSAFLSPVSVDGRDEADSDDAAELEEQGHVDQRGMAVLPPLER
jgi:hypothetical protein